MAPCHGITSVAVAACLNPSRYPFGRLQNFTATLPEMNIINMREITNHKQTDMTTTDITYRNETYICRVLPSNEGMPLIIAGIKLLDALMPYPITDSCDGFADKEAEEIDEDIFFYTDEGDLKLEDKELTELMRKENPEWF